MMTMRQIASELRSFELHGVTFWDFESITEDGEKWNFLIDTMTARYKNEAIDYVVCLDARGFLLGGAIASALGRNDGLKLIRKKGKLPGPVHSVEYGLEYRDKDVVEIQNSTVLSGKRVLLIDDVLATGGTAEAGVKLVEMVGGKVVGVAFAIELPELEGRSKLLNFVVSSEISIINGVPMSDVGYCVDVVATDDETGEIILIERFSEPTGHAIPGGHIDPGESALQAGLRELWEETGFFATKATYYKTLTDIARDPRGPKISLVLTTSVVGGQPKNEAGKTRVFLVKKSLLGLPEVESFAFEHGEVIHEFVTNM